MLVGRPPFQGASAIETIELVRTEEPVPPTRLQPKIPVDLETICLKCLQKDPAKRYSDADSLAEDLRTLPRRTGRSWHVPWGPPSDWHDGAAATPRSPDSPRRSPGSWSLVAAVSTYAAVSLNRANGQLDTFNKAESAARQAAQTNERTAA